MTTYVGTCYFVDRLRLIKYYKSQEYDIEAIRQKLDEGACFVGRPLIKTGDIVVLNDEGRYVIEDDPHVAMRSVRIRFEDPRYNYVTQINGTRKEICKYFDDYLNMAPTGVDYDEMMKPIGIVFLDAFPERHKPFAFK